MWGYVFIVHLHLFVHFSTTEDQTKAKAFACHCVSSLSNFLSCSILSLSLSVCLYLTLPLERDCSCSRFFFNSICHQCEWGPCRPVHGYELPLQNITYSAIFLLCKYGNRFSVYACDGMDYITNINHFLSLSLAHECIRKLFVLFYFGLFGWLADWLTGWLVGLWVALIGLTYGT